MVDVYSLIEIFKQYDCNLIAIMDNININSSNEWLVVNLLDIISQWKKETIIERSNADLEQIPG